MFFFSNVLDIIFFVIVSVLNRFIEPLLTLTEKGFSSKNIETKATMPCSWILKKQHESG